MKLADFLVSGNILNPFWLWCDIDGRGKHWRLAHTCGMDDGDIGVQIIHMGSADHFEDWAENYKDAEVVEILPPAVGGSK